MSLPFVRPGGLRLALVTGATVAVVAACATAPALAPTPVPFVPADAGRAFEANSWWNTPVPANAPGHPRAEAILAYMRTAPEAGNGCVRLAGSGGSDWGQPVYWSRPGDPVYLVDVDSPDPPPPELAGLRIPQGARQAETSDGAMTIFDLDAGYVVALTDATYRASSDSWSAGGATVTYLRSNGLGVLTGRSDDPRNIGSHRGNNGATMMVRLDEVQKGAIDHVLKIASGPEVANRAVFPMTGSDGESTDLDAPPQGLRFRIKPAVDLDALDLAPQTRVIAEAMQRYGVYIGDSSGVTALKLENTRAEGREQLWDLPATALCGLPLEPALWDVLAEGYGPLPASE